MEAIGFDEVIAKVHGHNTQRNTVEFGLSQREIKHIRRCLELYSRIHPDIYNNRNDRDLSSSLYRKFFLFGNIRHRLHGKHLLEKMKVKNNGAKPKCEFEGCTETQMLTIDHIHALSNSMDNGSDNLQWLCPKHHLLKELSKILNRKEKEIIKLREKIELVEKNEDPTVLGYQTKKLEYGEQTGQESSTN